MAMKSNRWNKSERVRALNGVIPSELPVRLGPRDLTVGAWITQSGGRNQSTSARSFSRNYGIRMTSRCQRDSAERLNPDISYPLGWEAEQPLRSERAGVRARNHPRSTIWIDAQIGGRGWINPATSREVAALGAHFRWASEKCGLTWFGRRGDTDSSAASLARPRKGSGRKRRLAEFSLPQTNFLTRHFLPQRS